MGTKICLRIYRRLGTADATEEENRALKDRERRKAYFSLNSLCTE